MAIGATPSCSKPPDDIQEINEFHPGNYVFYGRSDKHLVYIKFLITVQPVKCSVLMSVIYRVCTCWFYKWVDNVDGPPYRNSKADVSSVSPSSE